MKKLIYRGYHINQISLNDFQIVLNGTPVDTVSSEEKAYSRIDQLKKSEREKKE
jgi:hypothetical protein